MLILCLFYLLALTVSALAQSVMRFLTFFLHAVLLSVVSANKRFTTIGTGHQSSIREVSFSATGRAAGYFSNNEDLRNGAEAKRRYGGFLLNICSFCGIWSRFGTLCVISFPCIFLERSYSAFLRSRRDMKRERQRIYAEQTQARRQNN